MLAHGRDHYGAQHTPLFVSLLDRRTLSVPETLPDRPFPLIRPNDRVIRFGVNVQYDVDLYVALNRISAMTGDGRYATAVDDALGWFADHCRVHHGLFAWGTHIHWNCETEQLVIRKSQNPNHELICTWPLWDVFWRVAPESTQAFCQALWDRQILDHETGEFDRHCPPNRGDRKDFPDMAGRYIAVWAEAYAHTGKADFLHYIEVLLGRYEQRRHPATGLIRACDEYAPRCWHLSMLALAELCMTSASLVPDGLAGRLREFGTGCAESFAVVEHDLRHGVLTESCREDDGASMDADGFIQPWTYFYGSLAGTGLLAHRLHLLTGVKVLADTATAAADYYSEVGLPSDGTEQVPGTFAELIHLYAGLYRQTGREEYWKQVVAFADAGVRLFWDGGHALPRASTCCDHYESITGGASLARALLEADERAALSIGPGRPRNPGSQDRI
jgi:hypothetical protein